MTGEDDLKRLAIYSANPCFVLQIDYSFIFFRLWTCCRDLLKSDSAMVVIPELELVQT